MLLSKEQFVHFKLGVFVGYMRKGCVRLFTTWLCNHSLAVLVIDPFKAKCFLYIFSENIRKSTGFLMVSRNIARQPESRYFSWKVLRLYWC